MIIDHSDTCAVKVLRKSLLTAEQRVNTNHMLCINQSLQLNHVGAEPLSSVTQFYENVKYDGVHKTSQHKYFSNTYLGYLKMLQNQKCKLSTIHEDVPHVTRGLSTNCRINTSHSGR